MTTKQLEHRVKTPATFKERAKYFFVKNLRPTLFEGTMDEYKKSIESGTKSKAKAFTGALYTIVSTNLKMWAIRTGSAFAAYATLNYAYGVRSWNTGAPNAERMVNDAGPVSKAVITTVSGMFSPNTRIALADTLVAAEWAACGVRLVIEQAAWRKTKFSGEVAGTGMTPLMAGMLEAGYKSIESYPADPNMRFTIALMGIWGNFVRIVHSSLILAFGNKVWDALSSKKNEQPKPSAEKKNE